MSHGASGLNYNNLLSLRKCNLHNDLEQQLLLLALIILGLKQYCYNLQTKPELSFLCQY